MERMPYILIIGAIPFSNRSCSLGGVTVLMQNFLDFCENENYPFIHIPTNRYSGKFANLRNIIYLFICFILQLFRSDIVMFNVTRNGAFRMFPLLLPLVTLFHKKSVLRLFGGKLQFWYDTEKGFWQKKLNMALHQVDLIFAETSQNISYLKQFASANKIEWFPNVRTPSQYRVPNAYQKKFVFVSRIVEDKGVDFILDIFKQLGNEYTIDFYGPIEDKKYTLDCFLRNNIRYCGCIEPDNVRRILSNYNILLLPTFWNTEGYPGIIIEAMSIGMPTIATNWNGIPELIENNENGILIEIKNITALYEAVTKVTQETYLKMSAKALKKFDVMYNSEIINRKIYKKIIHI